ncbi:hypothetical protein [Streptomyces sp. NEAU-174]|uniref:hypothetical protein n=1 Tax=Streptomyces sp. NEAU-174 TaxID=3458254 RepID=UPI004043C870
MTRRLTPAERLAAVAKDQLLDDIVRQSEWSQFLVEQAVFAFCLANGTVSANDLREVLPELGHGFIGAAINSMRTARIISHTGKVVPSTSEATHGHRLAVWELTHKGRAIAAQRRARPTERAA